MIHPNLPNCEIPPTQINKPAIHWDQHLARSTMAAPSVTWLLLPAVVLPPALKASKIVVTKLVIP